MADWLNIAGGAAKGYTEGTEDIRRKQEFDSLQRQRQRVEKQQKLDDELTANLKALRPAGTYTDETVATPDAPLHESGLGVNPGAVTKKTTKISEADAARARAAAYERSGRPQDLQAAATHRQLAYQTEQSARQERHAQNMDVLQQAEALNDLGKPVEAMRHMQGHYKKVLDGHDIAIQMGEDGKLHAGVQGPDGRWALDPEEITKESVAKMIQRGYNYASPESRAAERKFGLEAKTVGAQETTAGAAARNATTNEAKTAWETTGPGGQSTIAYQGKHGNYFDKEADAAMMNARTHQAATAAANKKQTAGEKVKELTDFYTPLIMQANPGMPIEQARVHAAQVALRDPNAKAAPDSLGPEIVRIEGKYYKPDAKGDYKEWKPPADAKKQGAAVAGQLGVSDDGKPSMTEPNSTFKSTSMPSVTAYPKGGAPISPRELDDWVPQLGKSTFGIGGGRKRVNKRTGETITEDEFNQRTAQ